MARTDQVRVSIVSGRQQLREHDPPNDDLSSIGADELEWPLVTKVKYIEAIAGAKFTIRCEVKPGFQFGNANCLDFDIWVDGQRIMGTMCPKSLVKSSRYGWTENYSGEDFWTGTSWARRPFRWSNLVTTDSSYSAEETEKYHNIGTIQVEVWRCWEEEIVPKERRKVYDTVESVPEKIVKGAALDMCTK
ncbi:hypothetical protein G647_06755 [Cladophialophora carrionii CBS 160.54]|uniref:DUF7918 domain-containing protein n=1 Tax=Cladophialophora carrionii CBS 160.54 TaxID=1279043 RepID=V9D6X5_9EURO|nr:uncharacterized protein G647_06755 [Cladophialophora carrionii CBS 160.54]ETI22679.1 hypothetical protein G647_06755 [Cladophialophora carrionii CBS 160.54]